MGFGGVTGTVRVDGTTGAGLGLRTGGSGVVGADEAGSCTIGGAGEAAAGFLTGSGSTVPLRLFTAGRAVPQE